MQPDNAFCNWQFGVKDFDPLFDNSDLWNYSVSIKLTSEVARVENEDNSDSKASYNLVSVESRDFEFITSDY